LVMVFVAGRVLGGLAVSVAMVKSPRVAKSVSPRMAK